MYAYLKGTVAENEYSRCVIDVNNVGYNVLIPFSTAEKLPPIGSEAKLYTYTSVRENAIELIGFLTKDDLQMFSMLITVSGIGPKAALSILSVMDADSVRVAIVTGDVKALCKAPGMGKKSAERLIVDLKGKFDANAVITHGVSTEASAADTSGLSDETKEAIDVLVALGFNEAESRKAVMSVEGREDMNVDELIKAGLNVIR